MKFGIDTTGHFETFILLGTLNNLVLGNCRFPQFLQKPDPWVGDYKDGRIVAYVKPTLISLIERNIKFSRECVQRAPDNKYLVMHREENHGVKFLCMQFLQRGENIVQIKTSDLFPRQTLEICDENGMAIDPFPLVNSGQTPESRVSCPFTGGYNMYAYYPHPNNSVVCNNLMLLMRMESECDTGEGITFDFRREGCVPKDLPRTHKQRAHCVAHWTQDSYTFIILQHADVPSQWFCLRTADPLSNIKSAYLWLKVICDTSEKPSPEISQNYLRLELTKHIFSSTCADELEMCTEMTHYCNIEYSRHCAHTCGQCMSENQIGVCTFDEQYRGRWIESNTHSDKIIDIEAYSLHSGQPGKYDCLNLDSNKMTDKRVLLELYNNGCFPRYACIEMEKVTSSVMKFRFGDRLTWPLQSMKNQKEEICKDEHFRVRERHSTHFLKEKPARLLVNVGNIREVHCGLPERLQNGIAFREDGKHCGGCLNYDKDVSPNQFTISPVNCSIESNEKKGYMNVPIQYSCLASFQFYNNTFSVVTKTTTFVNGIGQYLVWIFTPENQIKVLKAADTYIFELSSALNPSLVQAQFSILRNDNLQCRNFVFLPRSTTTTSSPRRTPGDGNNNNNAENGNGFYATGTTFHASAHLTYNPSNGRNGKRPVVIAPTGTPRYENSKGERITDNNSKTRYCTTYIHIFLYSVVAIIVSASLSQTKQYINFHNIT